MTLFLLPALALLLTPEAPGDVVFETVDDAHRACIAGLPDAAEAVRRRAERWLNEGGGAPALHCQALGDLAAGFPKLAAVRFEELAERRDAGDDLVRARIYSQAALAWVEAGLVDAALAALDKAFARAPEGGELNVTAGLVYRAAGRHQAAIDAITRAEEDGYRSAAGYVARGRAKAALMKYREAADDVVAALTMDPMNVDALTLRGELNQRGVAIEAYYEKPKSPH